MREFRIGRQFLFRLWTRITRHVTDPPRYNPRRRPRSPYRHERRSAAGRQGRPPRTEVGRTLRVARGRRRGRPPGGPGRRRRDQGRQGPPPAHRLAARPAHLADGAGRLPARPAAGRGRPRRRVHARAHPRRQLGRPGAEQRLPVRRRQPDRPRRQGQPRERPAEPGPEDHPGSRPGRRGPRLLLRVRRRPRGHAARRVEHRHRQGQAVRLHHHPAVREELLPRPGTDHHPQGQGVLHRDQAGPRAQQVGDPGGLPQHQLLRPQRVRHPGRRPGVLRQELRPAHHRRGRLPRHPAQRAQRVRRRHPPAEPAARPGPLELRPGRHGQEEVDQRVRAGRTDVPHPRQGQAAHRPVRTARLPRRSDQGLSDQQQDHR